ncbi:hypothetical protein B0H67DRAFT_554347 [Lasiosphaeris hirsuta]|uniref:BHLH domain-containing protein n=1 Tax=Lasiosphaeris hirsuta TaxID=260670 RepID=A0AA40AHG5_9PEZI|nr:hypothetical protein B0H67DRAFT_554347 [Lasiosphaeris hirsuta]
MHPVTTDQLTFGLVSRSTESSFPERHGWPETDEVASLSGAGGVAYPQPTALSKMGPFNEPGLLSYWQQNWLDQNHQANLVHYRNPHLERLVAASPHEPPPGGGNHDLFTSPIRHSDASAQAEWDILRGAAAAADHAAPSTSSFPWVPPLQSSEPRIKVEDDSDSNWSLNDSSEDIQLPRLVRSPTSYHGVGGLGFRRRSEPRVSKVSRGGAVAPAGPHQGFRTFRTNLDLKRHTVPERLDLTEAAAALFGNGAGLDANTILSDGTCATDLYPDDFSSKVLEKRIAHKLSEKSRRNRLTAAIREIQKLMPESEGGEPSPAAGEPARPLNSQVSKVDVVEMAVGYIRRLQEEHAEMAKRVEEAEKELQVTKIEAAEESLDEED